QEEVALDSDRCRGIALHEELSALGRDVAVVEQDPEVVRSPLGPEAVEGKGEVQVADAELGGTAEGPATEERVAPDAIGRQPVPTLRARCREDGPGGGRGSAPPYSWAASISASGSSRLSARMCEPLRQALAGIPWSAARPTSRCTLPMPRRTLQGRIALSRPGRKYQQFVRS